MGCVMLQRQLSPHLEGLTQWWCTCSAEATGDCPDYLVFGGHLDFPDGWSLLLPEAIAPGKHHLVFHVAWEGGIGPVEHGPFGGLGNDPLHACSCLIGQL